MASAIDVTKPVAGSPTTESVRQNFAAAKSEIELLQQTAGVGPQGPVGPTGPAGTITVNPTVITGPAGSNAGVTVGGTLQAATVQFTVPRGDTGAGGGGITETQAVDAVRQANPNFSEVPTTIASIDNTQLAQAPQVNPPWTPAADGTATTQYTHDAAGTGVLAYPITGNMAPGQMFQIAFSWTNDTDPPINAATPTIFTVFLRTAPTTTTNQITVKAVLYRPIGGNPNYQVEITGTVTHQYLVVAPVTGFRGTFTLTSVLRVVNVNSSSLQLKTMPVVIRTSPPDVLVGGGRTMTSTAATAAVTGFGFEALKRLTTGNYNTAIGYQAMTQATTGSYSTALGNVALTNYLMGNGNVAIGQRALTAFVTGAQNTGVGYVAGYQFVAGSNNTMVGGIVCRNLRTGQRNTVVGDDALSGNFHGNDNVAMGYMAGRYILPTGTAVNSQPQKCTYLGTQIRSAAPSNTTEVVNEIVLGANAIGGGSNTIVLGNDEITELRCNVQTISALSDSRVKEDIEPANLDTCLEAVKQLPVSRWAWQPIAGVRRDKHVTGFMADDVKKVFPKAVKEADEYLTMRDAEGKPEMVTVSEQAEPLDDEDAKPRTETRLMEKTTEFKGLQRVELTEALPTLWGAVQRLIQMQDELTVRLEALKSSAPEPSGPQPETTAQPERSKSEQAKSGRRHQK